MDVNSVVDTVGKIPPYVGVLGVAAIGLIGYSARGMAKLNKEIFSQRAEEDRIVSMIKDSVRPYSMSVRNESFHEATRDYFSERGIKPQIVRGYEVYDCDEGKVILTEDGTVNVRSVGATEFSKLFVLMNRRHN